jgi:WG containing repeat
MKKSSNYTLSVVLSSVLFFTAGVAFSQRSVLLSKSINSNRKPTLLFPIKDSFSGKYGYIYADGKIAIKPQFKEASPFNDGYAVVRNRSLVYKYVGLTGSEKGYGGSALIDTKGKVIIQSRENERFSCYSNGILVKETTQEKRDRSSEITPLDWEAVRRRILFSYLNTENSTVIANGNDLKNCFQDGLGLARDNSGEEYFIDKTGKKVVKRFLSPSLTIEGGFDNGLAVVEKKLKNDRYGNEQRAFGYVDKSGKQVIPARYSVAYGFNEGKALVAVNNRYVVINSAGKVLSTLPLDIKPYDAEPYPYEPRFSNGLLPVHKKQNNGKSQEERIGYMDKTGKLPIPLKFKYGGAFRNGLAPVTALDGKEAYINTRGEFIWKQGSS